MAFRADFSLKVEEGDAPGSRTVRVSGELDSGSCDSVREAFDDAQLGYVVLMTSELVTNAVVHPEAEIQETIGLRITTFEDAVRVEVVDAGGGFDPAAPVRSAPDGGRGLFLVDACSTRWGTRHENTERGGRFRVWFELAEGGEEAAAAAGA